MGKPKFNIPQGEVVEATDGDLNAAPPIVAPCKFLRHKETGEIYPYSDFFARRGDLVEPYHGAVAVAPAPPKPPAVKRARKPKAQAAAKPDVAAALAAGVSNAEAIATA